MSRQIPDIFISNFTHRLMSKPVIFHRQLFDKLDIEYIDELVRAGNPVELATFSFTAIVSQKEATLLRMAGYSIAEEKFLPTQKNQVTCTTQYPKILTATEASEISSTVSNFKSEPLSKELTTAFKGRLFPFEEWDDLGHLITRHRHRHYSPHEDQSELTALATLGDDQLSDAKMDVGINQPILKKAVDQIRQSVFSRILNVSTQDIIVLNSGEITYPATAPGEKSQHVYLQKEAYITALNIKKEGLRRLLQEAEQARQLLLMIRSLLMNQFFPTLDIARVVSPDFASSSRSLAIEKHLQLANAPFLEIPLFSDEKLEIPTPGAYERAADLVARAHDISRWALVNKNRGSALEQLWFNALLMPELSDAKSEAQTSDVPRQHLLLGRLKQRFATAFNDELTTLNDSHKMTVVDPDEYPDAKLDNDIKKLIYTGELARQLLIQIYEASTQMKVGTAISNEWPKHIAAQRRLIEALGVDPNHGMLMQPLIYNDVAHPDLIPIASEYAKLYIATLKQVFNQSKEALNTTRIRSNATKQWHQAICAKKTAEFLDVDTINTPFRKYVSTNKSISETESKAETFSDEKSKQLSADHQIILTGSPDLTAQELCLVTSCRYDQVPEINQQCFPGNPDVTWPNPTLLQLSLTHNNDEDAPLLKSFLCYLQRQGVISQFIEFENKNTTCFHLIRFNLGALIDQAKDALALMKEIEILVDQKSFERPKGLKRSNTETATQQLLPTGVLAQHKLICTLKNNYPALFNHEPSITPNIALSVLRTMQEVMSAPEQSKTAFLTGGMFRAKSTAQWYCLFQPIVTTVYINDHKPKKVQQADNYKQLAKSRISIWKTQNPKQELHGGRSRLSRIFGAPPPGSSNDPHDHSKPTNQT